jgi:Fe2+ or Zn2+ uptake regulation protein
MRNIINRKGMEGHPVTAQRRLLLDLLSNAGGHMDARELYRRASGEDPSISLATVYRNLRLFRDLGMVAERRLSRVRCCYELKKASEHQHLVCKGCGKVIEFDSPLVRELVESVKTRHHFRLVRAELCLEGYCSECKGD